MATLVVQGADLLDTLFELETVEPPVVWNVSRLQRAAKAGEFGSPIAIPCECIPAPDWTRGNLSRERVDWIKQNRVVLDEPVISIANPPDAKFPLLCFVDGQHRGTARQELGLPEVLTYIVPHDREREFRVIERWL